MKSKNIAIFLAIVLLIAFSAYLTAFGLPLGKYDVVPVKSLIKLGLDLRGGATVLLQAKDDPNDPLNPGSDITGDGETVSTAFATLDKALELLKDGSDVDVTIQFGEGTFNIDSLHNKNFNQGFKVTIKGVFTEIQNIVVATYTGETFNRNITVSGLPIQQPGILETSIHLEKKKLLSYTIYVSTPEKATVPKLNTNNTDSKKQRSKASSN